MRIGKTSVYTRPMQTQANGSAKHTAATTRFPIISVIPSGLGRGTTPIRFTNTYDNESPKRQVDRALRTGPEDVQMGMGLFPSVDISGIEVRDIREWAAKRDLHPWPRWGIRTLLTLHAVSCIYNSGTCEKNGIMCINVVGAVLLCGPSLFMASVRSEW